MYKEERHVNTGIAPGIWAKTKNMLGLQEEGAGRNEKQPNVSFNRRSACR